MVEKEKLETLLLYPNQMTWDDVAWLEKLSQEFPYFQSLRILIAQHYLRENHLLKTHKIHSASAYAVDRNILRKRLLDKEVPHELLKTEPTITSKKIEAIVVNSPVLEQTKEIEIPSVEEEIILPEIKTTFLNNKKDKTREELLFAVQSRLEEINKNKTAIETDSILNATNKEIEIVNFPLSENARDININTSKEIQKNEPKKGLQFVKIKTAKELDTTKEVSSIKKSEDKKKKLTETKLKKENQLKEEVKIKANTEPEPKSLAKEVFDSKLGSELNIETTDSIDLLLNYLESQKEKKKQIQEPKTTNTLKVENTNRINDDDKDLKLTKYINPTDIIEKFIQNDPRISKPSSKIREVLEDLSETKHSQKKLISENLAKIQAKQGYLKEAIDIYQELILKNPEKKSYFVSQINKLKN